MNKILSYLLILLTCSCINKKQENEFEKTQIEQENVIIVDEEVAEIKFDTLFIDSLNFKYVNLTKFDLRGWYGERLREELKPFTSKEKLLQYFQNNRMIGDDIYPENYQYFSIQKNDKFEKIITIIEGDESCCHDLHYLIYDNENKLISDHIVAGTGGDGMWSYDQFGEFANDSTYILTRVDMEETELDNGDSEIEIDSIIINYRFYKNKPFEKLTELKFKKTQKVKFNAD
uniref:hypothetical protein n=1 Tax=Flavobacterium sp. TaxID=239 RepID=UPI0040499ADF